MEQCYEILRRTKANPINNSSLRVMSARKRGRKALMTAEGALEREWDIGEKIQVHRTSPDTPATDAWQWGLGHCQRMLLYTHHPDNLQHPRKVPPLSCCGFNRGLARVATCTKAAMMLYAVLDSCAPLHISLKSASGV